MSKPVITLEDVQALANQEGYTISVDEEHLMVVKISHPHVFRGFERIPDFSRPRRAGEYALMQAFYWILGYDLSSGDDEIFLLHRVIKHPAYTLAERVALELDFAWNCQNQLACLHTVLQHWMGTIEQLERLPAPYKMANGESPEGIQDDRIGARARQPRTGGEGTIQHILQWPNSDEFLWVQGNGYRFCDLEENLDLRWSQRARL